MTATALLLLIPLSAPPEAPADPIIEGRPVLAWIADLSSKDPDKQQLATETLIKAGPKAKSAVPALIKLLGATDTRRESAVNILGAIGPDAKEAVPALLELLPKESALVFFVDDVALALARIDGPKPEATRALLLSFTKCTGIVLLTSQTMREYAPQVVPHVVALCGDQDANIRRRAVQALGKLKREGGKVPQKTLYELAGDGTKDIPKTLEKLLHDDDVQVRMRTAYAIARVAPQLAEKTIPVVITVMRCEKLWKKVGNVHAVEIFLPVANQAAKELIPLLDSDQERVRTWAIHTLAGLPVREQLETALAKSKKPRIRQGAATALGLQNAKSIPALKSALADTEFDVRFAAAQALVNVGYQDSDALAAAVPVLIEGLQVPDKRVYLEATLTLRRVGEFAKAAIPALKKLLGNEKPEVRLEVALALVDIDNKDAEPVPVLIETLKSNNEASATRAAKALTELGPLAKDALPELMKHFEAKSPHLRLWAAEAVARIDPKQAPKAVEVIVGLLKDKKYKTSMVRSYSLVALKRIGAPAKSALPTLVDLLKDDGPFHVDVALAMIAIDPDGEKLGYDWLRSVLTNTGHDDYYDLVEMLPEFGKVAKPLVPELVKLLGSSTPYFRHNAIDALAALGPDAKDALPELKKLAESDTQPNIRKAAVKAVKKIEAE